VNDARLIVVLSGGGAKAAAHVGAMKALLERDMKPAHYVATSMGAVVAACFAGGLHYSEILKRVTSVSTRDVAAFSPRAVLGPFASNILQAKPLKETIEELVPAQAFDELEVPLTVTATDLKSGELVLFGEGGNPHVSLVSALYASSALPIYYPPQRIGDRDYVDGGLRAVLPLDVAGRFDPSMLYAVDAGPSLYAEPPEKEPPIPQMIRAHNQSTRILMAGQTEEVIARWRQGSVPLVLVRPQLEQEATFSVGNVVHFVEEGYRAASRALEEWESTGQMADAPGG